MLVRAVMSDGNYTDLEFPALPRRGEAVIMPIGVDGDEVWLVTQAGYRFVDITKEALAIIELERFEEDVPPPGRFDRMTAGR